jgi:hypothetical protein
MLPEDPLHACSGLTGKAGHLIRFLKKGRQQATERPWFAAGGLESISGL